ncbi:polymerase [Limosilactobacillus fermentum]
MKARIAEIWRAPIQGQHVYLLAFSLYFVPAFLIDSTYTTLLSWSELRLITYLVIPLLIFKIYVMDEWQVSGKLVITALLVASIISWRTAQYPELMVTMAFVLGARGVDFKQVARWYLYLSVTLLLVIAATSLVNIVPNLVYVSNLRPNRYGLGMAYTTFVASHLFFSALAYCYVRFGKLKWFDYIGIAVVATIAMVYTDTRLDFYAMLLMIPVMWVTQRAAEEKRFSRMIASFWWMAMPVLAVITITAAYFFDDSNHIYRKFNELLSGRLSLSRKAFRLYDPNLIGRFIHEKSFGGVKGKTFANQNQNGLSADYFYIDSSFVRMLLLWGLIIFVLFIVIMTFIAIVSTVQKEYALSAIVMLVAINSMVEPHAVQLIYNVFILASIPQLEWVLKNIRGKKYGNENIAE